ncbi:Enterobactin synthase component F [Kluyvera intermedia]|nr:Enterobactin synthase component F [Kluyvera intermedia]
MSARLPLIAAQPGIWMAEALSTLPNAWSVAHYVELKGNIDGDLLARAIATGMMQADTLRMRFAEDNGEVWQWVDESAVIAKPLRHDLRGRENPQQDALAMMQADLAQNSRVDSGNPLFNHQLFQIGDNHWFWYQRYHHLLVDGFSFPAITRQISLIYQAWQRGEATPESAFTPFSEVVEEYQRYRESEACQRDKTFWAELRKALPSPASLSPAPLPGRAESTAIWRLKLTADRRAFSRLTASHPPVSTCRPGAGLSRAVAGAPVRT